MAMMTTSTGGGGGPEERLDEIPATFEQHGEKLLRDMVMKAAMEFSAKAASVLYINSQEPSMFPWGRTAKEAALDLSTARATDAGNTLPRLRFVAGASSQLSDHDVARVLIAFINVIESDVAIHAQTLGLVRTLFILDLERSLPTDPSRADEESSLSPPAFWRMSQIEDFKQIVVIQRYDRSLQITRFEQKRHVEQVEKRYIDADRSEHRPYDVQFRLGLEVLSVHHVPDFFTQGWNTTGLREIAAIARGIGNMITTVRRGFEVMAAGSYVLFAPPVATKVSALGAPIDPADAARLAEQQRVLRKAMEDMRTYVTSSMKNIMDTAGSGNTIQEEHVVAAVELLPIAWFQIWDWSVGGTRFPSGDPRQYSRDAGAVRLSATALIDLKLQGTDPAVTRQTEQLSLVCLLLLRSAQFRNLPARMGAGIFDAGNDGEKASAIVEAILASGSCAPFWQEAKGARHPATWWLPYTTAYTDERWADLMESHNPPPMQ